MSGIKCIVFCLSTLHIFHQRLALVELPKVEDNDIVKTENTIRSTVNQLFNKLKLKDFKKKERLKEFTLIHNYFISQTLRDYSSLKEIARLSKVDKTNISNETANYIALLNDILNEDSNTDHKEYIANFENTPEIILNFLDDSVHDIEYFQKLGRVTDNNDINKEVLSILEKTVAEANTKYASNGQLLLDPNEFWVLPSYFDQRRIFDAKNIRIKRFPFVAAVLLFRQFHCAGAIINQNLVLTAASCLQLAWNNRLFRENPAFLSVRIGSSFYNSGGEEIPILEVFFHPTYEPKVLKNNLALMRLRRRINFGQAKKRVGKVPFSTMEQAPASNIRGITLLGWGARTRSNVVANPWVNRLSYAVLDLYPWDDCRDVYSKQYVRRTNFCAGFISHGGGACNHDVGAPGVINGTLVGVVSFGSPVCGTPDAPTVFTNVGYYTDWIEELMEQDALIPSMHGSTTLEPSRAEFIIYTSHRTTRYTLKPLYDLENMYRPEETPETPPPPVETNNKQKNAAQIGKFKDYLKTIFNSQEVQDYIDLMPTTNVNDLATNNEEAKAKEKQLNEFLNQAYSKKMEEKQLEMEQKQSGVQVTSDVIKLPTTPKRIKTSTEFLRPGTLMDVPYTTKSKSKTHKRKRTTKKHTHKTTESSMKVKHMTLLEDLSKETETETVTKKHKKTTTRTKKPKTKDSDEDEEPSEDETDPRTKQELEQDIMTLMNHADLDNIIKASVNHLIDQNITDLSDVDKQKLDLRDNSILTMIDVPNNMTEKTGMRIDDPHKDTNSPDENMIELTLTKDNLGRQSDKDTIVPTDYYSDESNYDDSGNTRKIKELSKDVREEKHDTFRNKYLPMLFRSSDRNETNHINIANTKFNETRSQNALNTASRNHLNETQKFSLNPEFRKHYNATLYNIVSTSETIVTVPLEIQANEVLNFRSNVLDSIENIKGLSIPKNNRPYIKDLTNSNNTQKDVLTTKNTVESIEDGLFIQKQSNSVEYNIGLSIPEDTPDSIENNTSLVKSGDKAQIPYNSTTITTTVNVTYTKTPEIENKTLIITYNSSDPVKNNTVNQIANKIQPDKNTTITAFKGKEDSSEKRKFLLTIQNIADDNNINHEDSYSVINIVLERNDTNSFIRSSLPQNETFGNVLRVQSIDDGKTGNSLWNTEQNDTIDDSMSRAQKDLPFFFDFAQTNDSRKALGSQKFYLNGELQQF